MITSPLEFNIRLYDLSPVNGPVPWSHMRNAALSSGLRCSFRMWIAGIIVQLMHNMLHGIKIAPDGGGSGALLHPQLQIQ